MKRRRNFTFIQTFHTHAQTHTPTHPHTHTHTHIHEHNYPWCKLQPTRVRICFEGWIPSFLKTLFKYIYIYMKIVKIVLQCWSALCIESNGWTWRTAVNWEGTCRRVHGYSIPWHLSCCLPCHWGWKTAVIGGLLPIFEQTSKVSEILLSLELFDLHFHLRRMHKPSSLESLTRSGSYSWCYMLRASEWFLVFEEESAKWNWTPASNPQVLCKDLR